MPLYIKMTQLWYYSDGIRARCFAVAVLEYQIPGAIKADRITTGQQIDWS